MKIKFFYFFYINLFYFSCVNIQEDKKEEINTSKNIVFKWSFKKSTTNNCDDDKSNSPTSCVFIYEGKRYLRNDSYRLNSIGKIDSIYSYHNPLGVNIYSIEDYGEYIMSFDTVGFEKMKMIQIRWDAENKRVIDNNETKKPTVIEDNKLIFNNKTNLIIYELR